MTDKPDLSQNSLYIRMRALHGGHATKQDVLNDFNEFLEEGGFPPTTMEKLEAVLNGTHHHEPTRRPLALRLRLAFSRGWRLVVHNKD